MFKWFNRKIKYSKLKNNELHVPNQSVSAKLTENIAFIKQLHQESSDIVYRSFYIGMNQEVEAFLVAIDGLYDKTSVHENVIKPLMQLDFTEKSLDQLKNIDKEFLSLSSVKMESSMEKSVGLLMKGDPLLFIDGFDKVYVLGARAWETRSIEEPVTETVVRGPREGFIETLRTNTAMLRRKIHHPKLRIQQMVFGKVSQTDIAIAYIDGLVANDILLELKNRLQKINIDAVLESGYIEEFIEDAPFSPFPTISNTERPDVVAARLLEGRVAIMVDGSSTVLVLPYLMMESFQSPEDYYSHPYYTSLVRILRLLGFLVSTLAPASYLAFENYHKEIFPTELLISIAASRETVPFPLFIEVLLMLVSIEWLREAGVRMPRPVGQAVSIVGALVVGESAVSAGLVGAPTVIIIALSAITSFLIPPLNEAASLLRFGYVFAAGMFGVYGIMLILTFLLLHVSSLRSFGIPYMAPWFPITWSAWKDFLIRAPLWTLNHRPEFLHENDKVRQADNHKPDPPIRTKRGNRN